MNEKHEETAQKIYKVVMLIVLTAFITFMITSLSLYTYFTKNPVFTLITGDNSSTESTDLDAYLKRIKLVIDKNYLWKEKLININIILLIFPII